MEKLAPGDASPLSGGRLCRGGELINLPYMGKETAKDVLRDRSDGS